MKLKFKDIVQVSPGVGAHPTIALQKILTANYERGAIPLSKLTYDLSKTLKSAEAHLKDFEEARLKIIKVFEDDDKAVNDNLKDGDEKADWRKSPVKTEQFAEEFNALMETEIELWHTPKPRTILDQAPGLTFTAGEFESIKWFFEPDADDNEQVSNVENIDDHRKKEAA